MLVYDVVIIGSGPAGIAAAATLQQDGLNVVILEKGCLSQAITQWPVYMKFFSTAANVELPHYPLITLDEKPTRQEYLQYLRRFVSDKKLQVLTGHRVEKIVRGTAGQGFLVQGHDEWGEEFEMVTRFVVVATGAYEHPKLLGVPGEHLHKVAHHFKEVHPYAGKETLVIGGRSGAAEAALLLWRAGAKVTLIHRGPSMEPLKWWLGPDLQNRIENGDIRAYFNTRVLEIHPHDILLHQQGTGDFTIPNDLVLAQTGYRPDVSLLEDAGVKLNPATNRPLINAETLETNIHGLFVAGVVVAGDISNEIFIENSRSHGQNILAGIRRRLLQATEPSQPLPEA